MGDGPDVGEQGKIIQLAALLSSGTDADPQLKICKCEGYFHDAAHSRIGLVSQLPTSTQTDLSTIASLSSLLSSKGVRPQLRGRVRLALALAHTVHRLHIYGSLHKSLRRDNIIFPPAGGSEAGNVPGLAVSLDDPRIAGFKYARRETDFSSVRQQHDHAQNLYRHPARWDVPTERFSRIHDLYALGVILLEIGIWERAQDMDRGALLAPKMANQPDAVRQRLLKHTDRRLALYIGTKYAEFTVFYMSAERPDNHAEEQSISEKVSQGLEYLDLFSKTL